MKKFCILVSLLAAGVWGQSSDTHRFSFDVGVTSFLADLPIDEISSAFKNNDVSKWGVSEKLIAPHIGLNVHHNAWTFGIGRQREHSYDVEINRSSSSSIDRTNMTNSWWSAYVERHIGVGERTRTYVATGATHSKVHFSSRRAGQVGRATMEKTEPFVRLGVSHQFKNLQIRVDATRRFTDADANNLIRLTLRFNK